VALAAKGSTGYRDGHSRCRRRQPQNEQGDTLVRSKLAQIHLPVQDVLRWLPDCFICVSSCVCLFEIRRLLKQKRGLRRAGTGGRPDPYVYMVREISTKQFALGCEFQTQKMVCVFGTLDDDF
jgi:hypothetical protein